MIVIAENRQGIVERERGDDMQQKAKGWNQTPGLCSKASAFIHGAQTLPLTFTSAPKTVDLIRYDKMRQTAL